MPFPLWRRRFRWVVACASAAGGVVPTPSAVTCGGGCGGGGGPGWFVVGSSVGFAAAVAVAPSSAPVVAPSAPSSCCCDSTLGGCVRCLIKNKSKSHLCLDSPCDSPPLGVARTSGPPLPLCAPHKATAPRVVKHGRNRNAHLLWIGVQDRGPAAPPGSPGGAGGEAAKSPTTATTPPPLEFYLGTVVDLRESPPCVAPPR